MFNIPISAEAIQGLDSVLPVSDHSQVQHKLATWGRTETAAWASNNHKLPQLSTEQTDKKQNKTENKKTATSILPGKGNNWSVYLRPQLFQRLPKELASILPVPVTDRTRHTLDTLVLKITQKASWTKVKSWGPQGL